MKREKMAIIGAGISGNTCAYLLQDKFECSLFEAQDRLGGHTNTWTHEEDFRQLPIDTGFIVYNERNYPLFSKLLRKLDVETQQSNMSFAYQSERTGLSYSGTGLSGLFADRSQVFGKRIYALAIEAFKFYRKGRSFLRSPSPIQFGDFLRQHAFSQAFVTEYIAPMCAAIWSAPNEDVLMMPAEFALKFLDNHGLLSLIDRPQWRTIKGGSHSYVKKLFDQTRVKIFKNTPVLEVDRQVDHVLITSTNTGPLKFDKVIFAVHADQVLKLIKDPHSDEQNAFSDWRYNHNKTMLHTDISVLPKNRRAWASWNYVEHKNLTNSHPVSVTYHMNRLQNLKAQNDYCVSLNLDRKVTGDHLLYEIDYTHPRFHPQALKHQELVRKLNSGSPFFFVGAYLGNGFHEDGVRSAVDVCRRLGVPF